MRRFAAILLTALAVLLTPIAAQADGRFGDSGVSPAAAIKPFKLAPGYATEAAYQTARTAAYARSGIKDAGKTTGDVFFDTTAGAWKRWNGSAWAVVSASVSLDAAYTTGQAIVRDLDPLAISDSTADATSTMSISRSAGSGALLELVNSGTGNDITGTAFSVDVAGVGTFASLVVDRTDPIQILDSVGDANGTVEISRTAGSGAALEIANSGTGPDIDGTAFSIDAAGIGTFTSLSIARVAPIVFTDAVEDAFATLSMTRTAGTGPVLEIANSGSGLDIDATLFDVDRSGQANFGDVAVAGINIKPNATAGTQITYLVQRPVENIYIPAGTWTAGHTGSAALGLQDNMAGWQLDDASTECIQTTWQPPLWVDTSEDVYASVVWAGNAAGDAMLELHRKDLDGVAGTSDTTLTDSSPDAKTVTVAAQKVEYGDGTDRHTITATLLSRTAGHPLWLQVCRKGGETGDTLVGDLTILGVNLSVTRKYAD